MFVAGFIGTPQMNFFEGVLTGTRDKVCLEFEGHKLAYSKEKAATIKNLDEYLNTGKPVVFGVRPEDFHDEKAFIAEHKDDVIEVKVEVVEKLGAETLLHCTFGKDDDVEGEGIKSLVDNNTQLVAKVDSRSETVADQVITIGIDMRHSHLFDKETELSLLEGLGTPAYIPEVELKRQEQRKIEEAKKAEEAAAKAAEKAAKKK